MWQYILRRLIYVTPILIGINIITFILFFIVNSPDDVARIHLGNKRVTQLQIEQWKSVHGYDKPLFYNSKASGFNKITNTLFISHSIKLFMFDFGLSDNGRDIGTDIQERMWPSLAIAIPSLILSIIFSVSFALLIVFFRESYIDYYCSIFCIVLLSISSLFFIIGGQFLFAKILKWFPISGYETSTQTFKFVFLPVLVAVIAGFGANVRWFYTLFQEESGKEYVITALAKGVKPRKVLFKHILKNAMIPILTTVILVIPQLFLGSLILESFFGIPGLGSYTIDAIQQQDFAIVKSMVFIGALLYILGLVITDLSYVLVDPRIKLNT
jgi:peptide/nickel transport system permease protein